MNRIFKDKLMISIVSIYIIGFIVGIVFSIVITNEDILILKNGIIEYINLINTNNFLINESLLNIFLYNFIITLIIFTSSFLIITFPIVYLVNFYKGFNLGFVISVFISIYKFKGIFYSFIFTFPHEVLLSFFIIFLSYLMLKIGLRLIKCLKNNENVNLKKLYVKGSFIFSISIMILTICTILEVYGNTFLIKAFL